MDSDDGNEPTMATNEKKIFIVPAHLESEVELEEVQESKLPEERSVDKAVESL